MLRSAPPNTAAAVVAKSIDPAVDTIAPSAIVPVGWGAGPGRAKSTDPVAATAPAVIVPSATACDTQPVPVAAYGDRLASFADSRV